MPTEIRIKILMAIVLCILAIALAVTVYNYRSEIGWFAWTNFRLESVATALNPKDAILRFDIGNYYFGGGAYDIEKAEKYFRKSLDIDPETAGAHYQLARVYFIRGDFYTALGEINKEIELRPDFKRSYYVRGLIYGYSGRLDEAEQDFKEFLKWKPNSWAGRNDLAWIYFQEGKYADARDAALAGLKIAPDNPWLLNSLGVALLNTGDKTGAKNAFAKALKILEAMNEESWGAAYPGNSPGIYETGFSKMKESIEANLKLLDTGDSTVPS